MHNTHMHVHKCTYTKCHINLLRYTCVYIVVIDKVKYVVQAVADYNNRFHTFLIIAV